MSPTSSHSPSAELSMFFEGRDRPELIRSTFVHPSIGRTLETDRGAVSVQGGDGGTFPWTAGVKALCVLVLRTKIFALQDPDRAGFVMSGERGSLARSLDFALSKTPNWLLDMLGGTSSGGSFARRLIRRGNPEQKRPGPVLLTINRNTLPPEGLFIYWDSKRVDSISELELLCDALEFDPQDPHSEQRTSTPDSMALQAADTVNTSQSSRHHSDTTTAQTATRSELPPIRSEGVATLLARLPVSRHAANLDRYLEEIRTQRTPITVLEDDAAGIQLVGEIPSNFEHSSKNLQWLLDSTNHSGIGFITFPSRRSGPKEAYEMFHRTALRLAEIVQSDGLSITWATRFDSCLRGHINPEMSAVTQAVADSSIPPFDLHVYAPAFFQGGRITLNGAQMARQGDLFVPVAETEYSKIPGFEYSSSYVQEVVEGGAHDDLPWFTLSCEALRTESIEALVEHMTQLPSGTRIVVDSVEETDSVVAALVLRKLEKMGKRILLRAAPSLLLSMVGQKPISATGSLELPDWQPSQAQPGLIVAGSLSGLTKAQLQIIGEREDIAIIPVDLSRIKQSRLAEIAAVSNRCNKLLRSGFIPLLTTRLWEDSSSVYPSAEDRNAVLDSLAQIVLNLEESPAWILIKGSDTCFSVVRWGVKANRLLSFGRFREGGTCSLVADEQSPWKGRPIILFPGNVGNEFSILRAVEALSGEA